MEAEYQPKYLIVPGWILATGVLAVLGDGAVKLLVVLGGYAHRKSGSRCWVSREILRRVSGLSTRSLVRAHLELMRHGIVSFSNRPGKKRKNRTMWIAVEGPFQFGSKTSGPEFAEYRRMIQRLRDNKIVTKSANPGTITKNVKVPNLVQQKCQIWHLPTRIGGFVPQQNPAQISARGPAEAGIEAGIETSSLNTAALAEPCVPSVGDEMNDTTTATGKGESSMLDLFEPAQPKLNKDIRGLEDIPEPKEKPPRKPRKNKAKAKKPRPRGLEGITAKEPAGSMKPPRRKKTKKPAAKKKRVSKKLEEYTDSPPHLLLDRHCKNFRKRFNTDYMPEFSKDLKIAKGIIKVHGLESAKNLSDEFFRLKDDKFIEENGFTFPMFRMRINKLVVRTKRSGSSWSKPRSGTIPVGAKRNETDRGYEFYWEEWDGSKWVPHSRKIEQKP